MDNCENIRDLLEAYADGELTEKQKELVERHVAHCPHCAALLDEYLALNAAIADCALQAPEGFAERVADAIQQERQFPAKEQGRGVRLGKIAPWIGFGIAAVLCVSIASSSLVKYVIGHLADPDISVESTTDALQGGAPNEPPRDESPSLEASPVPDTEEECGTQEEAVTSEEPTYEETDRDSIESPTYEETGAESIESPTYQEPAEGTTPPTDASGGVQDSIPEQDAPTSKPEVESTANPDAIESMQPETACPVPETEAPEAETQVPTEQQTETDAASEGSEHNGFFARIWQAIESFFDTLWQAVSRLFGGDA